MDPIKNFAEATLAAGIAADATTAPLVTGEGANLATGGAFDVNIWNFTDHGDNLAAAKRAGVVETARVTRSTDTLTFVTRGISPTSAIAHNTSGKTYKVRQVQTKEFFEQLAPKADAPLTGNTSYERTSPSIHNHGDIASGTLTLHATIGSNRANLTGTTLTVAFPSGAARALQSLLLTSSNAADGTITIPSSRSLNSGSTITSFTIPAGGAALLTWFYDGTTYFLIGETLTAAQVKAALAITIADTTGTVPVTRGGTGLTALGSALQVLRVNAAGTAFEFADATAGTGDVSAASNFGTDNRVVRSDGTTKGVQASSVEIDDNGNIGPVSDSIPNHVAFWDGHATAPKAIRFTAATTITTPYTVIWPDGPGTAGQILSVASVAGTTLTLQWSTP